MKKLLYILTLIVVLGATVTSCTEDPIVPTSENGNPGTGELDPKK